MPADTFYHMGALEWNPGFFCSYQSVIGFLNFCEQEQPIGFRVFFEKGLYFDPSVGPNWWEYYFEPIEIGKANDTTIIDYLGDDLKSNWNTEAISTISRERAAELIGKYIKVKQHIQSKLDRFVQSHFDGHYIIGIHYRGTDKHHEAPRVSYDTVRDKVSEYIAQYPNYKVFVATDEHEFAAYIKRYFGDRVCYTDAHRAFRSNFNDAPVHHRGGKPMPNAALLGEEAVIDCYLLAKTNVMIRTFSNLSSSAANINPNLPVVDLNRANHHQGLR